jgi:hypothetical protein
MRKAARALFLIGLLANSSSEGSDNWPNAFKCIFVQGYETVPENDYFKTDPIDSNDVLSFTIRSINIDDRTAQIVGNVAITNVVALLTGNSMNFIEKTGVSINLTSVYNLMTPNQQFLAAHSRHVGSEGSFLVSQRFGFCEAEW